MPALPYPGKSGWQHPRKRRRFFTPFVLMSFARFGARILRTKLYAPMSDETFVRTVGMRPAAPADDHELATLVVAPIVAGALNPLARSVRRASIVVGSSPAVVRAEFARTAVITPGFWGGQYDAAVVARFHLCHLSATPRHARRLPGDHRQTIRCFGYEQP